MKGIGLVLASLSVLAGTTGSAAAPSPSGRIAFARGHTAKGPHRSRIYRIPSRGGQPRRVVDMPRGAYDPAWSR